MSLCIFYLCYTSKIICRVCLVVGIVILLRVVDGDPISDMTTECSQYLMQSTKIFLHGLWKTNRCLRIVILIPVAALFLHTSDSSSKLVVCCDLYNHWSCLTSLYLAHMHIVNGKTGTRSPIVRHKCPSKRRMYIPLDPELRFLLLIYPGCIPHNHPIPPMSKASFEAKAAYEKCIDAAGTSGLTVQKVDRGAPLWLLPIASYSCFVAMSTKLLLDGKSPGEYAPALTNNRVKRELLHTARIKNNPAGLGVPGKLNWKKCISTCMLTFNRRI